VTRRGGKHPARGRPRRPAEAAPRDAAGVAQDEAVLGRVLLEHTPDLVLIVDADRTVRYTNRDLPHCRRDAVLGRDVCSLLSPDQGKEVAATLDRVFGTGTTASHVVTVPGPRGEPVVYHGRVLPVPPGGKPTRALVVAEDISGRWHAERVRDATRRIAEAAQAAATLDELFARIHAIIAELMPARNFYIALYDAASATLSFPYFADEFDPAPAPKTLGKGLTEYVLRTGRSALVTPDVMERLEREGEVELIGAPSIDWVGVPLVTDGAPFGVLVLQTYTEGERYGETELGVLEFVSGQIAMAITRARADEALRQSDHLLTQSQRVARLGSYVLDVPSGAWRSSPILDEIFGIDAAFRRDVAGWASLIHADDRSGMVEYFTREVLERRQRFDREYRVVRPRDGAVRWVHGLGDLECDAEGRVLRMVGTIQDVTERKRTEAALLESEERFRSFVETTTDWVWSIAADGTHTYSNPAVTRILGYQPDEMVGRMALAFLHPDDRAGVASMLARCAAERRGWQNLPVRWRARDGSYRLLESSAVPMFRPDGTVLGFRGVDRDISERRRLEEQLQHAQKMESVGRLAGGVAHDFNNILTVILSHTALLKDGLAPDDASQQDLDEIQRAAARAVGLTRQLLAFARRQLIEPRLLDLNALIRNLQQMVNRLIGEDIELVTALAPQPLVVRADPSQMEQLLVNLAVNSRDAMPGGGTLTIATSTVHVAAERAAQTPGLVAGDCVRLVVTDTGHGMSADTRDHAFEPFYTTKEIGKGTGLGLATCYAIVKQSGGYITLESEQDAGTSVEILLPLVAAEPDAVGPAAPFESPRGTETILLVEDEPTLRRLGARALRQFGYRVLEAANGEDALAVAAGHAGAIDLVVTDVVMPKMGGRELADRLREARPDTRVLFTSGYTGDAVVRHGVSDGAVPFLPKPFVPSTLAGKVRAVLDGPPAAP
jgi:PAS domain S-box-containing protein